MLKVNVAKTLRGPAAAFRLSAEITVKPGEILALFGPSGAGKTTLLRMVAGLTTPDTGAISFGGKDWRKVPPGQRGVGFVFQDHALFPNMTVQENLTFAGGGGASPPPVFGLGDLMNRYPHQLSGGQRQRVAVARTLVQGLVVLLLDEPLSALDHDLRRRIGTHLKEAVRERNVATILVSHDRDEVLRLADRVALLQEGKVTATGDPAELLLSPVGPAGIAATVLAAAPGRLRVRVGGQCFWVAAPPGQHRVGDTVDLEVVNQLPNKL